MLARYKLVSRGDPLNDGLMGSLFVAVSGVAKAASEDHPYAVSNEYICGQLGRGLGLPIPPGFIIEDGVPYHVSMNFNLAGQQLPPADCEELVKHAPQVAAGIIVFDAWILNPDRHARNLAFDQTKKAAAVFDHSHAFYNGLNGKKTFEFEDCAMTQYNCITPHLLELSQLKFWLDRVATIPRFWIEMAIEDATSIGLPTSDASDCIKFLDARRHRLRDLLLSEQENFTGVTPALWNDF